MNRMQKLLFFVSLLVVGITVLLGYTWVDEPNRSFRIRMGCLVLSEVMGGIECLAFSRSDRMANRTLPFTLGYGVVWVGYLCLTLLLVFFGGSLSLKWLITAEIVGFSVAMIVRLTWAMGGQSLARQEVEDRTVLAWRKQASLKAAGVADAMLAAFPGDGDIRKVAETLRDGLRYAATSKPEMASMEAQIDDTLVAIAQATDASRRDEVLQLCASAASIIKQRHRLAHM